MVQAGFKAYKMKFYQKFFNAKKEKEMLKYGKMFTELESLIFKIDMSLT